ncbi:MAG: NAD(+) diphosphatase [Gammaproteobacteria bacterium]|nr:NAD(+) diphosphatase [Gammaproteobacteria bacterium]
MTERINVFAGAHFDRLGARRADSTWIRQCFTQGRAAYLPVYSKSSLVISEPEPRAVLLPATELPPEKQREAILIGAFAGYTCFALDLGSGPRDDAPVMAAGSFRSLRTIGLLFPQDHAALLAYAQAMVLWHRRHRFCGRCGAPNISHDAGHQRKCNNGSCKETVFPRIDPAIIVLVEHEGRALLGRQAEWPEGVYSTIAGFVEPGESLEDAVRREVQEETGVNVGTVRYHSSQPWPFPSSLMLGFRAVARTTDITLNDNELQDACWFSRDDISDGLKSGKLRVPPPLSISSRLIAHWFDDDQPGRLASIIQQLGVTN